jgi:serine/threonine protein kinase
VEEQEKLMVPHLTATSKGEFEPQHLDLTSRTLPWHRDLGVNGVKSMGGFSKVHCVQIPPDFHSLHHWISKLGLTSTKFALKQLEPKSADLSIQFSNIQINDAAVENAPSTTDAHRREYEQLRNFHGFVNKHLITMLASYQYKQQHYIMFPWADKSLLDYWEAHRANPCDVSESQWFFSQLRGILSAVHDIHEPKHIKGKNGRHGDIKPENIVWFDLRDEPRGIFVLTDMGLTSLHREVSRSVVPNDKVSHTPTYHPPELVIEKGQISRAYDIWTLGCLFLEMSIWFTMGHDSLKEFHHGRFFMDISPTYFEVVPVKRDEALLAVPNSSFEYGVKVKGVVFEWYDRVRNSPKATQMIRDIVDLIETRMILVLARGTARATSASLMEQFDGINSKVHNKAGGVRYCSSPVRAGTGERQRAPAVVVAIPLRDIWSKRVKSRIQSLGLKPEAAVDFNRSYTAQEYEDMYNQ